MRIRDIEIKNFGSIETLPLSDLGQFTVIVGKNGSGKTFLFYALQLFFNEFQTTGGISAAQNDAYLWHMQDTGNPISISISLELDSRADRALFGQIQTRTGKPPVMRRKGAPILEITRELTYQKGWATRALKAEGESIVVDDSLTPEPVSIEVLPANLDLSFWEFHLFDLGYDSSHIGGNRLFVNTRTAKAYYSSELLDMLPRHGYVEMKMDTVGKDAEQWCRETGLEIITRPPTRDEAPELFALMDGAATGPTTVPEALAEAIRRCFVLLHVARDSREAVGPRACLLETGMRDSVRELSLSKSPNETRKWHRLRTGVSALIGKDLIPHPEQLFAGLDGLKLPLSNLGGGEQSVVGLRWHLEGEQSIVAIEEPENHLHPTLVKESFKDFKNRASARQIILSTHSPLMVDKSRNGLKNNWLFRFEGGRTTRRRIKDNDDLRIILTELGIVPSDVYLRDLVVLVEGGTEREAVFPTWGETLGTPIRDNVSIGLISIGGDKQLKQNLRIWLEVVKEAPTDYFVVLDAHATREKLETEKELGIPPDKIRLLKKDCIEDYYPPKCIAEALKAVWNIEVTKEQMSQLAKPDKRMDKTVQAILRQNEVRFGWKVALGQCVASRMTDSDIDDELKEVFKEIEQRLRTVRGGV